MPSNFASPKVAQRILIVRLGAMGDAIHALPAVHVLRQAFPGAHIGWLIEERWAELLCAPGSARRGPRSGLRPLVDEVHTVKLKAWGKRIFSLGTALSVARICHDVRGAGYDVALDLQGAMRSALLARWSGAGVAYGAAEPREAPASLWYTRRVLGRGRHVIEQNIWLAQAWAGRALAGQTLAGTENRAPAVDVGGDLPCDPQVEKGIEHKLDALGVREFAILNPGAGWGAKRWPAERYAEVARGLRDLGLRALLNYGPGEEELVRSVEAASGGTALAIRCSITELIALTRRASLFIGGDTGPLHLAAALRVPVVAIFGPTDPARNGPYGTRCVVLRNAESVTSHKRRAAADEGMLGIGSAAVLAAAAIRRSG